VGGRKRRTDSCIFITGEVDRRISGLPGGGEIDHVFYFYAILAIAGEEEEKRGGRESTVTPFTALGLSNGGVLGGRERKKKADSQLVFSLPSVRKRERASRTFATWLNVN